MPARDFHHDAVRNALIKDGWTITHDPFPMPFGFHTVYVDFGAETVLAAERGTDRIAVEVKGLHGPSEIHDLEQALGQFVLYLTTLKRFDGSAAVPRRPPCNRRRAFQGTADNGDYRGLQHRLSRLRPGARGVHPMETVEDVVRWREIIRDLLDHYASFKPAYGNVKVEVIADERLDHYELMYSGWHEPYRIHGPVIHIDIQDGKVWIQHDGTEDGVANRLVEAGIPKDKIVLAFKSPSMREFTGFAVT